MIFHLKSTFLDVYFHKDICIHLAIKILTIYIQYFLTEGTSVFSLKLHPQNTHVLLRLECLKFTELTHTIIYRQI